jgi:hypothetical protein
MTVLGTALSGRVGFGRIPLFPYTAPYEDITLKGG